VAGGAAFYPATMARELLQFYRGWAKSIPDELTTLVAFLNTPPEPFIPAHLHGTPAVAVALCYAGPVEDGMRVVQPLKDFGSPSVDLLGPIPYVVLQHMFDASAPRGIHSYWKTEYLADLSDGAIAALSSGAAQAPSPLYQVHIQHLGGAVGRVSPDATAFGRRDMSYVVNLIGLWPEPSQADQNVKWVRNLWQALQPYAGGGVYLNFMDADEQARVPAAYGPNYARLAAIKAKYDPTNLFRLNQNIQPQA